MDISTSIPSRSVIRLSKGQRIKAKIAVSNVNVDDIGEVRADGEHEFHLIYWLRQKARRYYKGSDMEIL